MASFDEYAALARQLHDLQRDGERTAAMSAQRRDATLGAADQLGHRLAFQQQRLHQLARAIGEPAPNLPAPPGLPPASNLPMPPQAPPPAGPGLPPGAARPGAQRPVLPGPPVYPELPAGPPRLALPSTPAAGTGPWPPAGTAPWPASGAAGWPSPPSGPGSTPALPAPRSGEPAPGLTAPGAYPVAPASYPAAELTIPAPWAAPPDPVRALELARQAADAADEAASRTETMAQQPPLLPGWSPLGRAATVYAGCALVAIILAYGLFLSLGTSGQDLFTFVAWAFGGFPALALFAGYLVLTVWGTPRIVVGRPARYARIGFLICFLATPLGACALALLPRLGPF